MNLFVLFACEGCEKRVGISSFFRGTRLLLRTADAGATGDGRRGRRTGAAERERAAGASTGQGQQKEYNFLDGKMDGVTWCICLLVKLVSRIQPATPFLRDSMIGIRARCSHEVKISKRKRRGVIL